MRLLFLLVLMVAACSSHYSKPPALPTGTQQVSPVGPPPEQLPGSHYSAPGQHPEPSSERLTGSVSSHHRSVRSTWNGTKQSCLSCSDDLGHHGKGICCRWWGLCCSTSG